MEVRHDDRRREALVAQHFLEEADTVIEEDDKVGVA